MRRPPISPVSCPATQVHPTSVHCTHLKRPYGENCDDLTCENRLNRKQSGHQHEHAEVRSVRFHALPFNAIILTLNSIQLRTRKYYYDVLMILWYIEMCARIIINIAWAAPTSPHRSAAHEGSEGRHPRQDAYVKQRAACVGAAHVGAVHSNKRPRHSPLLPKDIDHCAARPTIHADSYELSSARSRSPQARSGHTNTRTRSRKSQRRCAAFVARSAQQAAL